jgi:phosphohistidine phosphatase
MKRLAVMRHAKSDWDDAQLDDFDRPLNARGWKTARKIGRELRHRELRFDLVVASTAARVRETIDGVQEKFDFAGPIQFEQRTYLASEEALLTIVRELPETVHRPLLVGHNPGLQQLVLSLTDHHDNDARDKVAQKFPTAAIAVIELPTGRWNEVGLGSGKIVELILPKDLD